MTWCKIRLIWRHVLQKNCSVNDLRVYDRRYVWQLLYNNIVSVGCISVWITTVLIYLFICLRTSVHLKPTTQTSAFLVKSRHLFSNFFCLLQKNNKSSCTAQSFCQSLQETDPSWILIKMKLVVCLYPLHKSDSSSLSFHIFMVKMMMP